MKNKLTMQDIADKLNISKNSVSQALSGKDGVSEETRNLIQQTADEMGYMYPGNRKLKTKEGTGNIALIASDFTFSQTNFFGEIYLTIERETALRGMNLHIQSISQGAIDQLTLPSFLQNQNVDGILILSHIDTEYTKKVISTGIPVVLIDHHHPLIYADSILTNNRFAAFDAVQYLLDLGHHDIGFIGNIHYSPSSMAIDLKLYGKKAIEQLFWRMNHKDEPFMETAAYDTN